MYVAIAGNIGSGKSSLTRLLSDRYGLQPVFEAVDENPYLSDFYERMDLYGFHSQIFFLARRLKQHLAMVNPGEHIVQDRTVFEDAHIFATNLHRQGIMNDRDFASYMELYEAVSLALRPPDLLVYLQSDLKRLRQQIELRGRDFEAGISDTYLLQLQDLYEEWIGSYTASKLLIIPAADLDFVHDESDRAFVWRLLEQNGLPEPIL